MPLNSLLSRTITAYSQLEPEINKIGNEVDSNRIFIFFDYGGSTGGDDETLVLYELPKNYETILTKDIVDFNINQFHLSFWDPHNRINYCYLIKEGGNRLSKGSGWHELYFSKDDLKFTFTDINTPLFEERKSPPAVFLKDSGYNLLIDYSYEDRLYSQEVKIADIQTDKIIWESSIQTKGRWNSFKNIYWISGKWLFIEDTFITSMRDDEQANYNLFNFHIEETKSYHPDKIIGYGQGYIITTSKDFYGITIQDPEGHIIFKDDKFDLVGMLRDHIFPNPYIYMAYFDSPFVYYEVKSYVGTIRPCCSVIVDLKNLKSYRTTDYRTSILGIF